MYDLVRDVGIDECVMGSLSFSFDLVPILQLKRYMVDYKSFLFVVIYRFPYPNSKCFTTDKCTYRPSRRCIRRI